MAHPWAWWIGFNAVVLVMLAVDLAVFHRRSHEVRFREALAWSAVWIAVAFLFTLGLWRGWIAGYPAAARAQVTIEFLSAYLIEKSLSVDNLFVFAVIFTYFAVPAAYQHRVLFYGIVGALVFRGTFILGGLWLIHTFSWMIYVFGALLIIAGVKLAWAKDKQVAPDRNPVMRLARAALPLAPEYDGSRFTTHRAGRLVGTPLVLVLILIETTDIIFALDSIPAVIAITKEPFLAYTSNVLAILGLRALYFVLAALLRMFRYLSYGLAVLLVFTGLKMIIEPIIAHHLPAAVSLGIIAAILTVAVVASLMVRPAAAPAEAPPAPEWSGPSR